MDEHEGQRFSKPATSHFGWKGYRKDPTNQTTIATVVAIINWVLVVYVVSELGEKDASGVFHLSKEPVGIGFYLFAGLAIASCTITSAFIRYQGFTTRWGARAFVCGLPASLVIVLLIASGN